MPEETGKSVRRSNRAVKPPSPEPVEIDWQGTKMWGCPFCGWNNEDKDWTVGHIRDFHPGGETP